MSAKQWHQASMEARPGESKNPRTIATIARKKARRLAKRLAWLKEQAREN
jgi:hypothetical protein